MDAECIAKGRGIEVVFLFVDVGAGVVGEMEGIADVDAENKHIHVVTETDARADSNIIENIF